MAYEELVDKDGAPLGTAGNPLYVSGGGGGGGGAVTIADGANVAQGALADAAVTTDVNGTLSAKTRGLVKMLGDVWDSVNHRLKVDGSGVTQPVSLATAPTTPVTGTFWQATQPVSGTVAANAGTNLNTSALALETGGNLATLATRTPALGSAVSASSRPVVIASDQSAVLVTAAGGIASGSADSGNPLKAGGKYNSTLPTFTDGLRGDLQIGARGALNVSTANSAAVADASSNTAGFVLNGTNTALAQVVDLMTFNETTWDRMRGNVDKTVGITASAVTSTQTGADQTNYNGRGVIVVLDMTAVGTGSVTLEIDGKDLSSGKYYALLTGAAVVSNSTNVYMLYPGVAAVANAAVSMGLPRTWRVKVTANNANAASYTVSASVIL